MKAYRLFAPLTAVFLIAAASPAQITAAASDCGLAADDLAWRALDPSTLSITRISPTVDQKKMFCFGKWLRDNNVRMGLLSNPVDPQ